MKPENVNLCLKEEEIKEIAERGQLTSTKMGEMSESLKKIAVGNVLEADTLKPGLGADHRGRGTQEEDQNAKLDK